MKEAQHKESFMLGYNRGLDDAGVKPEDERRVLVKVPHPWHLPKLELKRRMPAPLKQPMIKLLRMSLLYLRLSLYPPRLKTLEVFAYFSLIFLSEHLILTVCAEH
ncbi:hypothetical protein RHMOL_Rhmol02G0177900 [Rhododendron molle]|uniref:Uncharacterized protein n=1 Tax=Rhododendron molle TaxID=49168 RepID=A0ACC0PSS6_RHOML|nr:hypothetical protein RHMOL_Rhmol02G0177900 [Rhododendron molle]